MPLPGFPVAGIFGLVGMAVVLLRRRNEATILLLFVLGHMASVVMFFVSARYRISVIPVLLIFASVAVADLADLLRKKHYKKMGLYGIEVGVAALVVYFPWKGLDDKYLSALTDNNLGLFYAANNDANRALGHFESAIRTCPSFWKTYNNLGNLYLSAGSKENALALYEKGLRMGLPEDSSAMFLHMSLGIFYLKNGDTVRAKSHFRIAMPYVPYSIMIWQLRPNAFRKLPL
jgi:tetratricopeptide (TPR) repeat protein